MPLCLARQDALAQLRGAGLRREDLKRQAQFVGERAKGIAVGALLLGAWVWKLWEAFHTGG